MDLAKVNPGEPMSLQRTVLLVSPTPSIAKALSSAIRRMGHHVLVTKTFEGAKRYLSAAPHLLVTELKLGAYNGLHLALRAGATAIPTVVIADDSFEHEVEQIGAVRLSAESAESDSFRTQVVRLLQGIGAGHAVFPWYDERDIEERDQRLAVLRPISPTN
jgi:DNA-binding NtrC family response regulator